MFLFLNASPKLTVTEKTYTHNFHISNKYWLLTTVVKNNDPTII